ncbi:MAG: cobyrinate a,c-diamide synthase [Thermoplasmatales archaeon]|nr:cobyrinate a,c-diamide synthase [Thermoplasmatales archaeon]
MKCEKPENVRVSALTISSDRSDSGKTTISLGLMNALSKSVKVSPFKAGPDFIDPMYHKIATGGESVNLDLWLMGKKGVKRSFNKYSTNSNVSIIEGVMGFYDGMNGRYSTWELSQILNTPVILVIDCSKNSTTSSAVVTGLKKFKRNNIKGVIFNNVASDNHYRDCTRNLPEGVVPLGWIPHDSSLSVGSRHLGLLTPDIKSKEFVKAAGQIVSERIDLDRILDITNVEIPKENIDRKRSKKSGKAALALDNAFLFYYKENIEYLRGMFDLEFFSPLADDIVNDPSFIYLGGGYPEIFADKLEGNNKTKNWIRKEADKGTPILGECGGLMYLSSDLKTDKDHSMVGIFDVNISMSSKLTIGYTELKARQATLISNTGSKIKGHEFHKSKVDDINEKRVFTNLRGKGLGDGSDGVYYNNVLALYSHIMFPGLGKFIAQTNI